MTHSYSSYGLLFSAPYLAGEIFSTDFFLMLTSNSTGSVVLQSPHALVRLNFLEESVL